MRTTGLLLVVLSLVLFASCGGGSSHGSPVNPVFTSVPVTAATQAVVYRYQLAATDPSGGAVTFALATAPAGAVLSGSTIAWTPSGSQSRVSNSFTARASTPSGGSATQSWTVSPVGTVTVNWVTTAWTPTGPVQNPIINSLFPPAALVPQPDGSLSSLPGSLVSPGVFAIPNVPAGHYWLMLGALPPPFPGTGFWTSSSSFDAGRDIVGALPSGLPVAATTTFDFTLSGLDPALPPGAVTFSTDTIAAPSFFLNPQPGSTTYAGSVSVNSAIDWTQVHDAFLTQYEPFPLGTFNNLVLGPELTLSNLTLANGVSNPVTGALAASAQTSLNLSVPGSQWTALLNNVGPSAATLQGSWLSVSAEPYLTGRNASPRFSGPNLYLVQPGSVSAAPLSLNLCPGPALFGLGFEPAVLTDQNFGTLPYGDPFPSDWTRVEEFCETATVTLPVNGLNFVLFLNNGENVAPSNAPLAPLAGPVQNPTINGVSLLKAATVNSAAVTLNWSAPSGFSPYGYTISVYQGIPKPPNGLELLNAGTYGTAETSATLPPLVPGDTYLFVISTNVDGVASMETGPYRSQLPVGFSSVLSAPITISAGATVPVLHGDPAFWKRLMHPKGESHLLVGVPVGRR